jgi:methylenetetrahydrofolate--tRNA-(uracil-5-)-methyltransferase
MDNMLKNKPFVKFSSGTAIGSLPHYLSSANEKGFQPMNSNWGIISGAGKGKEERAKNALDEIKNFVKGENNGTI